MTASLLKHALQRHPAHPAPPGLRVEVQRLAPDDPLRPLQLRFELLGDLAAVQLPAALPSGAAPRADGLWRHTCFEAFIAAPSVSGAALAGPASVEDRPGAGAGARSGLAPYVEFNLAPSGAWAAYRFDGYRAGMRPEWLAVDPRLTVRLEAGRLRLDAALAWPEPLPGRAVANGVGVAGAGARWHGRLGLTAVVEAADGTLSYWALHHPAARADFHNVGGFILGLEVPE